MHSFVGKHRLSAIDEEETFTRESVCTNITRISPTDRRTGPVLFDFQHRRRIHRQHGRPMLTIDVAFRQLKIYSKVRMACPGS